MRQIQSTFWLNFDSLKLKMNSYLLEFNERISFKEIALKIYN